MTLHTKRAAPDGTGGGSAEDQLGSVISLDAIPVSSRGQDLWPISIDGRLVGFVIACLSGCEAITAGGAQLGRFNTQDAAVRALIARTARGVCDAR